jgi:hypothetical protein
MFHSPEYFGHLGMIPLTMIYPDFWMVRPSETPPKPTALALALRNSLARFKPTGADVDGGVL